MISESSLELHVLEAVLANPQFRLLSVLLGVRRKVPRVHLVATHLHTVDVFYLCDCLVLSLQGSHLWIHVCIIRLNVIHFVVLPLLIASHFPVPLVVCRILGDNQGRAVLDHLVRSRDLAEGFELIQAHPGVHSFVSSFEVDIVFR